MAHTTTQSARAELEQNIFCPFSTHSPPLSSLTLRKRVLMRATSEPASGSVMAMAPQRAFEWSSKIDRNRWRCSGVPVLRNAGPPRPGPGSDSATPRSQ
ncbi:MAG: hypothetical protein R2755_19880 [Acidimicrobiales bacterium]